MKSYINFNIKSVYFRIIFLLGLLFALPQFSSSCFGQTEFELNEPNCNEYPELCEGTGGTGGSGLGGSGGSGLGGSGGGDSGDDDAGYGWDDDFGQECWYCDDWGYEDTSNDPNPSSLSDCPELYSETKALLPVDRQRKILGIGEEIRVQLIAGICEITGVQFGISNSQSEAKIISESGTIALIDAGRKPGKFTLIVEYGLSGGGCSACPTKNEIEYEVIEPTGIFFELTFAEDCPHELQHIKDKPSMGYFATWYLTPANVNFYKLKVRELDVQGIPTGPYFVGIEAAGWVNPTSHQPTFGFTQLSSAVVEGKGTKCFYGHEDIIRAAFLCKQDWNPSLLGVLSFEIEWEYSAWELGTPWIDPKKFCTTQQKFELLGGLNAKLRGSKGNVSKENLLEDPTTCLNPDDVICN